MSADLYVRQNQNKKIPLMEVFGPTVQGEGALTGQLSYFIRTGVCPYRCLWCDQPEAVEPKLIKASAEYLTQEEILQRARKLYSHTNNQWVTLSGGDPLVHNLEHLVLGLKLDDMKVSVETQGSFCPDWLQYVSLITCSPKPPSSGMHLKTDHDIIQQYREKYGGRLVLKVVIFDHADLDFAEEIKSLNPHTPFYLSLGTPTDSALDGDDLNHTLIKNYQWLAKEFLKRPRLHGATISPQMHVFLYSREKGK